MHPDKFPIRAERNGRPVTLHLGHATPAVKRAYCQWLKPRYVAEAWENTQSPYLDEPLRKRMTAEYQAARQEVNAGGIYWTANACIPVAVSILTEAGNLFFNRLLLGESAADWSDDELLALIRAKLADEASDYAVAMDAIWEAADPKAEAPSSGPSPDPTGTSGTSPASPPATST